MPFKMLGLEEGCSSKDVLKAWRRLAREHHTDKTGSKDDAHMKVLNDAKEQCLEDIKKRNHTLTEQEFVSHICRVLESNMAPVHLNLRNGDLIRPTLRKFYWLRSVDAMDWILKCAIGIMEFDQTIEDELPILCRYYNDFIGQEGWSEEDHTMMMVLNTYDQVKSTGFGNFARFVAAS